jgi:hypothetical protein
MTHSQEICDKKKGLQLQCFQTTVKTTPSIKKKEKKRKEDLKVYLLNYRYYSEKKEGSISTPQP